MRTSVPFFLVDVFADTPLTGNPLAVVADAERLEEPVMRAVAREFNQSETTFVLPPTRPKRPGGYARSRRRAPRSSGPDTTRSARGGGSPRPGGSARRRRRGGARPRRSETASCPCEVTGRDGRPEAIVMEQAPPELGRTVTDRDELAGTLGLDPGGPTCSTTCRRRSSRPARRTSWCPREIATAVDRARPDAPRLAEVLAQVGGQGCYLYCLEPVDPAAVAHARFFNPTVGIGRIPATGSAAGPLVSRLVAEGVVPDGASVLRRAGSCHGTPEPDPGAGQR